MAARAPSDCCSTRVCLKERGLFRSPSSFMAAAGLAAPKPGATSRAARPIFPPWFAPLSEAKFTWFTINYRLAPQHRWPASQDDVESAIRWVRAHAKEYKVDVNRIALIGESAGGHLVSMVGARAKGDTALAAVVPFY